MASKFIAWAQLVSSQMPRPVGNSVEAIRHAYSLGYDGVEMDLRLTRDGVAVLMHDDTLDATTNGSGLVADKTFAELQELQLYRAWNGLPVRIPSLAQALAASGAAGTFLCDMRINSSALSAITSAVDEAAFDHKLLQLSAYSAAEGRAFKSAIPEASVFLKTYDDAHTLDPKEIIALVGPLDGLMVQVKDVTTPLSDLVKALHEAGKEVISFVHYAEYSRGSFDALVEAGIDFILTMNHQYFQERAETPTWSIKKGVRSRG